MKIGGGRRLFDCGKTVLLPLIRSRIGSRDRASRSGENTKLGFAEGAGGTVDWLGPALRGFLQIGSQVGAALLHLVAQFATGKGGEGWIAQLLPCRP
jgi:hypothetical protein